MTFRIHVVTISHALAQVQSPSLAKCVCLVSLKHWVSSVFTYVNLKSLFRFFYLKTLSLAVIAVEKAEKQAFQNQDYSVRHLVRWTPTVLQKINRNLFTSSSTIKFFFPITT